MAETDLEVIEAAYLALYQAEMGAALAAIEAEWVMRGDVLVLPPIATWQSGNIPDIVGVLLALIPKFPGGTIEAVNLTATDKVSATVDLVIQIYTLGKTPVLANKLTQRYGSAARRVLRDTRPLGVGIKGAGPITINVAETARTREAYLKAVRLHRTLLVGV